MTPGQIAEELKDLIIDEVSGLDELGRRIVANRLIGVLTGWLPEQKKAAIEPIMLEAMKDGEARAFGNSPMLFGKYAGQLVDSVDLDYLRWLADSSRETWRDLTRYLTSPRISGEED